MNLLAQESGGVSLDLTSLIQYGALGVIVLVFMLGTVLSTRGPVFKLLVESLTTATKRAETAEADNKAMQTAMTSQVIPALVRATDALMSYEKRQNGA